VCAPHGARGWPNEQSTVGKQSELAAGQLMACCATLSAGTVVVVPSKREGKNVRGATTPARVLISVMVR